ncbi:hypothetical protein Pst134EA_018964 [Puccinia striiformis f. sp. tritici]|uniref:hypothetical protein n=1 Tax=Puccinia striiformis f. sp. tritici TaxID=168172 RepID=UPI0020082274|nr:hypothetical protein Pst134EA_018964 [Puccinia striiformis f. sp. tritici]KAH9449029.1 hypothetical protein Pst134EB_019868 [Puccinia striiformis f. sp. tritici]KAH9458808.1 hypothetical protein Pst134EA_018964 [Puccinia striiformis f. sp. tritici]
MNERRSPIANNTPIHSYPQYSPSTFITQSHPQDNGSALVFLILSYVSSRPSTQFNGGNCLMHIQQVLPVSAYGPACQLLGQAISTPLLSDGHIQKRLGQAGRMYKGVGLGSGCYSIAPASDCPQRFHGQDDCISLAMGRFNIRFFSKKNGNNL